ncbi:hypothetical protein COSO111634_35010 [Corallococcus soli]
MCVRTERRAEVNAPGGFHRCPGGHARDDRVDAMVWPIYKHVVKMRRNVGAAAEPEPESPAASSEG